MHAAARAPTPVGAPACPAVTTDARGEAVGLAGSLDELAASVKTIAQRHPVDQAIDVAIERLIAFRSYRVSPFPTVIDGKDLNQDIDVLCGIFDGVFSALGHYAQSTLGIGEDARVR